MRQRVCGELLPVSDPLQVCKVILPISCHATGKRTTNVLPLPSWLCTEMLPP